MSVMISVHELGAIMGPALGVLGGAICCYSAIGAGDYRLALAWGLNTGWALLFLILMVQR